MLSKRRSVAAILLILGSCGPGDAPYRFFVGSIELQLEKPGSLSTLGNCRISPTNLHIDIGLMKDGDPGMQSIPRHLVINPYNPGWNLEIVQTPSQAYSIRLRGTRPQELQFQPGTYRVAITGYADCSEVPALSKLPFFYSSEPSAFAPGKEINLAAKAVFADQALGCQPGSGSPPSAPVGFTYLTLNSLDTSSPVAFFAPTAPSLSGQIANCSTSSYYLGPVPAHGRYYVRFSTSSAPNFVTKCYRFEGSSSTGASPLTGTQLTLCPTTGTIVPQ